MIVPITYSLINCKDHLLYDGGSVERTLYPLYPKNLPATVLRLTDDELLLVDTPPPNKGLLYLGALNLSVMKEERLVPTFIKPPRKSVLNCHHLDSPEICREIQRIIQALLDMETTNLQKRGDSKPLLSDRPITVTQATSVGPKAHRFKCGVSDNSFHYHLLCEDDRVKLEKFYRNFESAVNV